MPNDFSHEHINKVIKSVYFYAVNLSRVKETHAITLALF